MLRRHTMMITQPLPGFVVNRIDTWWTLGKRVFRDRERIVSIVRA